MLTIHGSFGLMINKRIALFYVLNSLIKSKRRKEMKPIIKLGVLFATLLLLTGVAFATNGEHCSCYAITLTYLENPENNELIPVYICFDSDNVGTISDLCHGSDLYMFFDSMNEQALTYLSNAGFCAAYLKFHGDDQYVVTGIIVNDLGRATFRGHKVESCPG
jgi:hypothetical protein